jgi:hypothetical protein
MHDTNEALPLDGLYVPVGQGMQDDDEALPLDGLYVPASQVVHEV